ncbi:hypothetical protein K469DRAFT_698508 [Zopfia rhizophila CBS 207.26]|uniref:Uncharacterized protein n=1 Tax=Zopfia rhizophila CBS 207.26 TaxID=1314779 RepID=A0A6A6EYH0_9PEZI|nr:hypothetical protein K469DRAFT_698508 [Zopfia rhizophila CBS 207.26]
MYLEIQLYFPWAWTIESADLTTHKCPSVSSLLGTFAAVNGVVSLLAVIFGHRLVIKKITCGICGKRGSRAWTWMWIVPVGLQLAANAFIALLIKKSDGYYADFKISELMLFLVARPRLSWIVLGAFAFKSQKAKSERKLPKSPNPNSYPGTPQAYQSTHSLTSYGSQTPLYPIESPQTSAYQPVSDFDDEEADRSGEYGFHSGKDFPWWSAFMSQFIGEFILQIITLYIMGRTAHFATNHGYYKIYQKSYWKIPAAARMMYSGALYYLVAGSLFLICAFLFILYTMLSSRIKFIGKASSLGIFSTLLVLLISTWMGSWIFWAGFVKLAGTLYCPPKLIHQGVIWTFFSTIGILLGTGL